MLFLVNNKDWFNFILVFIYPVVFALPFFYIPQNLYLGIAYWLAIWFTICNANYLFHIHVHKNLTRLPILNKLIDLLLGFVTGWSRANWNITHIATHHSNGKKVIPFLEIVENKTENYSLINASLFSLKTVPFQIVYPTYYSIKQVIRGKMRYLNFLLEILFLYLLIFFLFFYNPFVVLIFILPMYFLVYFLSRYIDYITHIGCDFKSIYTLSNNSESKYFNFRNNNFGYHTAHHLFPNAHWSELPTLHNKIKHKIPKKYIKEFSFSGLLYLYHGYLSFRKFF